MWSSKKVFILCLIMIILIIFSLKAEWLYSQGQGRKFHTGQHDVLVRYLTETCPITSHALETEQERKLRLVLSKAQQYREQLHSKYRV